MTNQVERFTSEIYMIESEPIDLSCVKCGIPMMHFDPKGWGCGHCGLFILDKSGRRSLWDMPRSIQFV